MTTIATIAANSWSISIGGGWIVLMLVGMGLCFVFMLGSMWLMRDAHAVQRRHGRPPAGTHATLRVSNEVRATRVLGRATRRSAASIPYKAALGCEMTPLRQRRKS